LIADVEELNLVDFSLEGLFVVLLKFLLKIQKSLEALFTAIMSEIYPNLYSRPARMRLLCA
jgi:hypothetical protein